MKVGERCNHEIPEEQFFFPFGPNRLMLAQKSLSFRGAPLEILIGACLSKSSVFLWQKAYKCSQLSSLFSKLPLFVMLTLCSHFSYRNVYHIYDLPVMSVSFIIFRFSRKKIYIFVCPLLQGAVKVMHLWNSPTIRNCQRRLAICWMVSGSARAFSIVTSLTLPLFHSSISSPNVSSSITSLQATTTRWNSEIYLALSRRQRFLE